METRIIRKNPLLSMKFIFLIILFLVTVGVFGSAAAWFNWATAAVEKDGQEKTFTIAPSESVATIASNLKREGLIRDELAFRLYARFTCAGVSLINPLTLLKRVSTSDCLGGQIQAGVFKLSTGDNLAALAVKLTKSKPVETWVKIREGLRNEEVAKIVEDKLGIKQADFLALAKIGYMFPDSYLFQTEGTTAQDVAAKMRSTFDKRFTSELQAEAAQQNLSADEAVTLASIVERESGKAEDSPLIASVFLNRLSIGMALGSDVTVQYALGFDLTENTWWKKELNFQDLAIESPYNTRVHAGLPPGPICNPGLAALKAVAEPAQSDYYYFLYDKDGNVHFGKNLEEHNANKAKYL